MFRSRRSRQSYRIPVLALATSLVLLLSSCQVARPRPAALPDDGPAVPTSSAAARQFVEKITVAGRSGAQTGQVSLTVTEQEVTSFLQIGSQLREQLGAAGGIEHLEDLAQLDDLEGLEGIEGLEQWRELAQRREGLPRIPLSDMSLRVGFRQPEVRFLASGQMLLPNWKVTWHASSML